MFHEALHNINLALEMGFPKVFCLYRRGFALKALKRFQEAASDFETCKKLEPMNPLLNLNYKGLKDVNYAPLVVPGELDL